jgi:hypothetical protein
VCTHGTLLNTLLNVLVISDKLLLITSKSWKNVDFHLYLQLQVTTMNSHDVSYRHVTPSLVSLSKMHKDSNFVNLCLLNCCTLILISMHFSIALIFYISLLCISIVYLFLCVPSTHLVASFFCVCLYLGNTLHVAMLSK